MSHHLTAPRSRRRALRPSRPVDARTLAEQHRTLSAVFGEATVRHLRGW